MLFHSITLLNYAAPALFLVYLLYLAIFAQKNKFHVIKSDIVYQEWFASGHSEANFLTKIGGARNCLRLIVTAQHLIVASWFPFSIFTAYYDLEHVIPLKDIVRVEKNRTFVVEYLLISYRNSQGQTIKISLNPKNWQIFLEAIGQNPNIMVN